MLSEHLTPKPKRWAHDRSQTLGASEFMNCSRALFARKHGIAPDDDYQDYWGFAERGNIIEDWAVARLRAAGVPLRFAGDDQTTLKHGQLSATPDGLLGRTTIDIKSRDPRKTNIPERKHIRQVQLAIELWNGEADDGLLVISTRQTFKTSQKSPSSATQTF